MLWQPDESCMRTDVPCQTGFCLAQRWRLFPASVGETLTVWFLESSSPYRAQSFSPFGLSDSIQGHTVSFMVTVSHRSFSGGLLSVSHILKTDRPRRLMKTSHYLR